MLAEPDVVERASRPERGVARRSIGEREDAGQRRQLGREAVHVARHDERPSRGSSLASASIWRALILAPSDRWTDANRTLLAVDFDVNKEASARLDRAGKRKVLHSHYAVARENEIALLVEAETRVSLECRLE